MEHVFGASPLWKRMVWVVALTLVLTGAVACDGPGARALVDAPATFPSETGWRELGRWQGERALVSDAFAVRGPWRFRWRLTGAGQTPLRYKVLSGDEEPAEFQEVPAGAREGVVMRTEVGTFRLMLQSTEGYAVVVEERE